MFRCVRVFHRVRPLDRTVGQLFDSCKNKKDWHRSSMMNQEIGQRDSVIKRIKMPYLSFIIVTEIQRFSDTEIQWYTNTEIQWYSFNLINDPTSYSTHYSFQKPVFIYSLSSYNHVHPHPRLSKHFIFIFFPFHSFLFFPFARPLHRSLRGPTMGQNWKKSAD